MNDLMKRYLEACNYPGVLDERAVTAALTKYCRSLNITRRVRRLGADWRNNTDLMNHISLIAADVRKRMGISGSPASAASEARAASDARDASDAHDAQDALAALAAQDAHDAQDAHAALAARDARDARDAQILLKCFAQWCILRAGGWYWWDLSFLVTTHIGAVQRNIKITWAEHIYDAYVAGVWLLFWTSDTLYWVAKPTVSVETGTFGRRLHCENGPACANDVENLYFWHGVLVPAYAVVAPEMITIAEVRAETNAEVRRVLIERMTPARYLTESGAKLLHADVEAARKGAAARALLVDETGDKWLVGTDGGTGRVYYMPVPRDVRTCREAHCAICGFDEAKILVKS
jgi:hypothetical protein